MAHCNSILIVEDDLAIRNALRDALDFEGYTVFSAANGREGLELLPKMTAPCLILLDLMMPVMNGWEFAEALGKDMVLATIPLVVVSAYPQKLDNLKVNEVIKKPVNLDLLLDTVKKYCGSPRE